MPATLEEWKVLPHGSLTPVTDGILTVTGEIRMPLMKLPRRMTLVRLNGRRLVVFNAIALDEDEMRGSRNSGRPPS